MNVDTLYPAADAEMSGRRRRIIAVLRPTLNGGDDKDYT